MTNLRDMHVFSVTQHEEKMSHLYLGLCSLRVTGFKRIPCSSTFAPPLRKGCYHGRQIEKKKKYQSKKSYKGLFGQKQVFWTVYFETILRLSLVVENL